MKKSEGISNNKKQEEWTLGENDQAMLRRLKMQLEKVREDTRAGDKDAVEYGICAVMEFLKYDKYKDESQQFLTKKTRTLLFALEAKHQNDANELRDGLIHRYYI